MARAEKSIVVRVPVPAAFHWWTAYEEFPEFLDGVTQVRRAGEGVLHWDVEIAGRRQQWDARIEEQRDSRVAWRATGGAHARGEVELRPVEGGQTLVTLRMEYEPEGAHDVEAAGGMVDRLVMNSLERFKAYAEPREPRRSASEDEPPPRGAETVRGPQGDLGGPLDADAGELPFSERGRVERGPMLVQEGGEELLEEVDDAEATHRLGADDLDVTRDPDVERGADRRADPNDDDNTADWSRT